MLDKTIKCLCGRLYMFYSMMVGDQSVCPKCRAAAQDTMRRQEEADRNKQAGIDWAMRMADLEDKAGGFPGVTGRLRKF